MAAADPMTERVAAKPRHACKPSRDRRTASQGEREHGIEGRCEPGRVHRIEPAAQTPAAMHAFYTYEDPRCFSTERIVCTFADSIALKDICVSKYSAL